MAPIFLSAASAASPSIACKEHIQEERLENVVAMMAKRDLGNAVPAAKRYSAPRRSREHRPHIVLPSGMTRFTTP